MTVPRVVSIEYRFRPESDVHDYSKAPPWAGVPRSFLTLQLVLGIVALLTTRALTRTTGRG